ncbi:excisionase family DNA-binding protein [Radiobacillus sp. PE A8.2]|uniref:excisionase family DNA-binding protein n=1 Tax=Radiobacillus sp. PE A8.2 TaxID=3380349 RepID=UPI00388F679C
MYLTIKETAEHLALQESDVRALVLQNRIRAIHDGDQYLINKQQFTTYKQQIDKLKADMQAYLNEPIPEDIDIKDED